MAMINLDIEKLLKEANGFTWTSYTNWTTYTTAWCGC